ncbi:MAG: hypothetical protein HYY10_03405 [Candidatus Liptonbacteria bacterium]|nr:hypothetical protein [Candidatus Liptonbacteria bacterium]
MDLNIDTGSSPAPRSQTVAPPLVPTPPAEVFVRTMESDIRSLRESGGARPKPDRIVVGGNAPKEEAPKTSFFAQRNIDVKWLLVAGGAALALGAVLVYSFSRLSLPSPSPAVPETPAAISPGEATSSDALGVAIPAGEEEQAAPLRGIFRKAADRTASFTATGFVQSVTDLKTPNQRLGEVLAATPAAGTSTLIEVIPGDAGGTPVPLGSFFTLQDISAFPENFLSTHFADTFAMFVYRDKQGLWPGYVLTLKPAENWLFLKDEVAKLESSPKLANFYLADPGEADEEWSDARVGDVAVRQLNWTPADKSAPKLHFVYGWFRGYLLISTSREGFAAILPRL